MVLLAVFYFILNLNHKLKFSFHKSFMSHSFKSYLMHIYLWCKNAKALPMKMLRQRQFCRINVPWQIKHLWRGRHKTLTNNKTEDWRSVAVVGFKMVHFSPLKPFWDRAITLRYGLQAHLILISSNAFCDIT